MFGRKKRVVVRRYGNRRTMEHGIAKMLEGGYSLTSTHGNGRHGGGVCTFERAA